MSQNTYVLSINGLTGDLPYEMDNIQHNEQTEDYTPVYGQVTHRHKNLVIDADDIPVSGVSGPSIRGALSVIANTMRPMILEQIDGLDDYIMMVQSGIPYEQST